MARAAVPFVLALALAAPAAAQVVSEAPEKTAVTIYRSGLGETPAVTSEDYDPDDHREEGLAFIVETRTVDLPAGRSRIAFRGVADTMVPETAAVEGLPGGVVERNEDTRLLSAGSLLEAYIDKPVRLIRTDRATGRATVQQAIVRSGPDQPVLEIDGRLEGLRCSGAPERLQFDEAPAGLSDKPVYSVIADVPTAGRYPVRLSYLATGFNWSADYVARVAPDGRTLDLFAWLTLANHSTASFVQAPTDVVAGDLAREYDTRPPEVSAPWVSVHCWPVRRRVKVQRRVVADVPATRGLIGWGGGGGDGVEEIVVTGARLARQSDLGDYKLYTLPEPTTVAARQTKQVAFLDQKKVPFERLYTYRFDADGYDEDEGPQTAATVVLRLKNTEARGLGKPLPAGTFSVTEAAGAGLVLAGEHRIKDTPVGLPLDLEIGRAMDLAVDVRVVEDKETPSGGFTRLRVDIANDKPERVTLEYRQVRHRESMRVTDASRRAGEKNGEPLWTFRLAPGERATLTYTLTYRDD